MVAIPQHGDPTLEAMKRQIELQPREERNYLGASLIGNECAREIWYTYNKYPREPFDAKTLMNFEDGHNCEAITAKRLQTVPGIELATHHTDGKQFGFSTFNGRFRGHYDGKIIGLLQAPRAIHIWEHKSSAHKKWNEFKKAKAEYGEKGALKAWNKNYYVQANLYMHYEQLERHYLTVSYAGAREYDSCRTEYNPEIAAEYIDRAYKIIETKIAPPRISEKKDFYICRWCAFKDICHD